MTKSRITTEMSKGQQDNTKTSPKSSITQRLWSDLGRSDGVTDGVKNYLLKIHVLNVSGGIDLGLP